VCLYGPLAVHCRVGHFEIVAATAPPLALESIYRDMRARSMRARPAPRVHVSVQYNYTTR
jgi:hypothetical protein